MAEPLVLLRVSTKALRKIPEAKLHADRALSHKVVRAQQKNSPDLTPVLSGVFRYH